MKAIWNDAVIAESDDTVVVEGNHYFPIEAVNPQHIAPSPQQTVCGWKGTAHYFDVLADGQVNANAAWFYPDPKDAAEAIRNRVAFWKGVRVGP
jgi:uncharacterized protein (DUF427 family)